MPTVKRRSTKRKTGLSVRNKLILKALLRASGVAAIGYGGYRAYKSGVTPSSIRDRLFGPKKIPEPPRRPILNLNSLFKRQAVDIPTREKSVRELVQEFENSRKKTGGKRRSMRRM